MGLNFFEFLASLSRQDNKIITTSQDNLLGIPGDSTAKGGKLNLILFNHQANIIHNSGINSTVQKRRLV